MSWVILKHVNIQVAGTILYDRTVEINEARMVFDSLCSSCVPDAYERMNVSRISILTRAIKYMRRVDIPTYTHEHKRLILLKRSDSLKYGAKYFPFFL